MAIHGGYEGAKADTNKTRGAVRGAGSLGILRIAALGLLRLTGLGTLLWIGAEVIANWKDVAYYLNLAWDALKGMGKGISDWWSGGGEYKKRLKEHDESQKLHDQLYPDGFWTELMRRLNGEGSRKGVSFAPDLAAGDAQRQIALNSSIKIEPIPPAVVRLEGVGSGTISIPFTAAPRGSSTPDIRPAW
jgi:hypothetical protein